MLWIKSGIENPSKSVIGRCGGDEKNEMTDFEGFSIPDFIHNIYFPILIHLSVETLITDVYS